MTRDFRRTARTRRGSSVSTRGRWGRSGTVRSACRCTRSANGGRCRWGGRCICRRSGARMSSDGARRRSRTGSCSRPSRSSGSSLVERAAGWDVPKAPVLGDHAYGENTWLRDRLDRAECRVRAVGRAEDEGVRTEHPVRRACRDARTTSRACPAAAGPQARADRRADRPARSAHRADGHLPRRARRRAGHLQVHLRARSRRTRLARRRATERVARGRQGTRRARNG